MLEAIDVFTTILQAGVLGLILLLTFDSIYDFVKKRKG